MGGTRCVNHPLLISEQVEMTCCTCAPAPSPPSCSGCRCCGYYHAWPHDLWLACPRCWWYALQCVPLCVTTTMLSICIPAPPPPLPTQTALAWARQALACLLLSARRLHRTLGQPHLRLAPPSRLDPPQGALRAVLRQLFVSWPAPLSFPTHRCSPNRPPHTPTRQLAPCRLQCLHSTSLTGVQHSTLPQLVAWPSTWGPVVAT